MLYIIKHVFSQNKLYLYTPDHAKLNKNNIFVVKEINMNDESEKSIKNIHRNTH